MYGAEQSKRADIVSNRAIGAGPEPRQQNEIDGELQRLDSVTQELNAVLSVLNDRLRPVSLSRPGTDAKGPPSPVCSSPVGAAIGEVVQRVRESIDMVHAMVNDLAI